MLEIGSSLHNDSYRADFLIVRLWRLFAKASILVVGTDSGYVQAPVPVTIKLPLSII